MDKKEKDCAYWVAVLVTGLVLGVVAGFVFGWIWKEGPASSEATKLVDVFIAIGTVGATLVALSMALYQVYKNKYEQARLITIKAAVFSDLLIYIKVQIDFYLEDFYPNERNSNKLAKDALSELSAFLSSAEKISENDLVTLWHVDKRMATYLAHTRSSLINIGNSTSTHAFYKDGQTYKDYFESLSIESCHQVYESVSGYKRNIEKSSSILRARLERDLKSL